MGNVLMPSFVAGGLPVVLTAAEMTQATALLDKRAALGDWQSAAVLKRMVEGRHRQQEIFHFADGTRLKDPPPGDAPPRTAVPRAAAITPSLRDARVTVVDRSDRNATPMDVVRAFLRRGLNPMTVAQQRMAQIRRHPVSAEALRELGEQMAAAAARAGLVVAPSPMPNLCGFDTPPILPLLREMVRYQSPAQALERTTGLSAWVILEWNSFADLLSNERVVDFSYDWPRPTVERADLSPQDLFEFYQLVFAQGLHFRGYLALLELRGGRIGPFKALVDGIDEGLQQGLQALLSRDFTVARGHFARVDETIQTFQRLIREEGRRGGLDIHPFGIISLLGEGG